MFHSAVKHMTVCYVLTWAFCINDYHTWSSRCDFPSAGNCLLHYRYWQGRWWLQKVLGQTDVPVPQVKAFQRYNHSAIGLLPSLECVEIKSSNNNCLPCMVFLLQNIVGLFSGSAYCWDTSYFVLQAIGLIRSIFPKVVPQFHCHMAKEMRQILFSYHGIPQG